MTPARSLWVVMVAVALLIGVRPIAGNEQFPSGLLAAAPKEGTCTIETRPVNFGTYQPMATTDKDATGEVRFTCHRDRFGRLLRVRIEISRGGSGSFDERRMRSSADQLFYNLYLKPDARNVWGDGSGGTDFYFELLPPSDTRITVPVYGRIFSMQDVGTGDYADTLQVTIIF